VHGSNEFDKPACSDVGLVGVARQREEDQVLLRHNNDFHSLRTVPLVKRSKACPVVSSRQTLWTQTRVPKFGEHMLRHRRPAPT